MENPFQTVTEYLNQIDSKLNQLIQQQPKVEVAKSQLLTIEQTAEFLHCSIPTLYSKHSKGQIPGVSKVGKRLLFNQEALLVWIAEKEYKTKAQIQDEARKDLVNKKGDAL